MSRENFEDFVLEAGDYRALERMRDFIPKKVFDVHTHFYDVAFIPCLAEEVTAYKRYAERVTMEQYRRDQYRLYGNPDKVRCNIISMPDDSMADLTTGNRDACTRFLLEQLEQNPDCVGEAFVMAQDDKKTVESLLVHPNVRGFKCYHLTAAKKPTWQANIGEYLPESAWQVAEERGFCITLHMVKEHALSDPDNLSYIVKMAKKYPNAKLILAHAARGFAPWTTMDAVSALSDLPNVYFDVSAICESPAIFEIIKRTGTGRTMWGSDFPVSMIRGKCVSLSDSFYWLYKEELRTFDSHINFDADLYGVENLLALQQACRMHDLSKEQVADIFYNNAMRLFQLTD